MRFLLPIFFIFLSVQVFAQIKFQRYYGGSSFDEIYDVVETADNDVFIVGATSSYTSGGTDALLIRTDSSGKVKWAKRYGGTGDDVAKGIIFANDTTLMIVGSTGSFSLGSINAYVICLDTAGNIRWSKTYGGSYKDEGYEIIKSAGGNFVVVGIYGNSSTNTDHLLFEIDPQGNLIWAKKYGGSSPEQNGKIITSQDGNYLIIANTISYGKGSDDAAIMKVDTAGNLLWYKTYGGTATDGGHGLTEFSDGSIIINGSTASPASGYRAYIIKTDSTGKEIWAKYFTGTNNKEDRSSQILRISPTEFILLGNAASYGNGNSDITLTKMDTSCTVSWIKTYGGSYLDYNSFTLISKMKKGGYLAGGRTKSFNSNSNEDAYLIRVDDKGNSGCYETDTILSLNTFNISVSSPSVSNSTVSLSVGTGGSTNSVALANGIACISAYAAFGWTGDCAGTPVQFLDSSLYEITKWTWTFNDSFSTHTTDSNQNPTHIFKYPGTYEVTLIVENGYNKDTITKYITIKGFSVSAFGDTTICMGKQASIGVSASGSGLTYLWKPAYLVSDSTSATPKAFPAVTTNFVVYVTSGSTGCTITDTVTVVVDTSGSKCPDLSKAGGIINQYAQITALDTCFNYFTVDTASFFKVGDKALLIQMQGALIDSSNNASFGDILDYRSAGNYEIITVDSVSGKRVYSRFKLKNTYDTYGAVQLVTIPEYEDLYISSKLTSQPWNGTKGGILIFRANGLVTLGADIDVSGKGFRGGGKTNGVHLCNQTDYYYNSTSTYAANKGEGIAAWKNAYLRGRGALANGGGGGNATNAGGGGGGNYNAGGIGGMEFKGCTTFLGIGGLGGKPQSAGYSKGKIFMGGGGGAGQANNNVATSGMDGGGIAIIFADRFAGNNNTINAKGLDQSSFSSNDGSGGGGAGGSVLLNINSFIDSIKINANGGYGGSTNFGDVTFQSCHGPGGGGSGGLVYLNKTSIPSKLKTNLSGGAPGTHTSSKSPCYQSSFGADSGYDGKILLSLNILASTDTFVRNWGSTAADSFACPGDSVQLTATGGASYAWYPAQYFNDTTLAQPKAIVSQKRTFYVRIYNASGCYKVDSVVVDTASQTFVTPPVICGVSYESDSAIEVKWTPTNDSLNFGYYVLKATAPGGSTYVYSDTISDRLTDTYLFSRGSSLISGQVQFALQIVNACGYPGSLGAAKKSVLINVGMVSGSDKTVRITWNPISSTTIYIEENQGSGWSQIFSSSSASQYDYTLCDFSGKFRFYYTDQSTGCKYYSNTKQLPGPILPPPKSLIYVTSIIIQRGIRIPMSIYIPGWARKLKAQM